jgi:long-chain acyl-CoA synthetase
MTGAPGGPGPGRALPSLAETFAGTGAGHPARLFLRYFDVAMSYGMAQRWVDAAAAGLRSLGVERGDRVGLMLQNQPEFVLSLLACWRLGAAVVPINIMLKAEELRYILADSGAKAIVCLDEAGERVVTPAAAAARARSGRTGSWRPARRGRQPRGRDLDCSGRRCPRSCASTTGPPRKGGGQRARTWRHSPTPQARPGRPKAR